MSTDTLPETPATEPAGAGVTGLPAKPKKAPKVGKPGKGKRIVLAIAAVVLFGGGIASGMAIEDPTASEEYTALAAEKASVESARDGLQSDYDGLKTEYDTLNADIEDRETAIEERAADLEKAESELKEAEAAVKKREKAVTGAEKEKAANTIHEGTWTVGTDIAAGTYRTTDAVDSDCYWGIYTSGTNGDDIIANDIPGGGRPTVTLSKGQDFNTTRCGTWQKQ